MNLNRRLLVLTLAGTLSLGLLSACGGGNTPAPETTPSAIPSPQATAAPTASPDLPEESPEEPPIPEETGAPELPPPSDAPAATAKPQATPVPTQKPGGAVTPAPTPESTPSASPVASTWNDIAKLDLPSLMDVDADTLSALYGIDAADVEEYICKMPMMSVQATEFFIAKVKDGKLDAVKSALEQRQKDLEEQWSQYLPAQLELVQNYKLVSNGNYILFAVSESAPDAVSAFNTYTK